MKKILWILPLTALFLYGCGQVAGNNSTTNPTTGKTSQKNSNTPTTIVDTPTPSNSTVKFAEQSYFKNAYLISTDTLSTEAKTALAGFKMDKQTLPDGTIQINLKALEPQYHDQSYTLKDGEQLYFIDKFLADDSSGTESNIGDDTAVIVDSQGNVVQQPTGF